MNPDFGSKLKSLASQEDYTPVNEFRKVNTIFTECQKQTEVHEKQQKMADLCNSKTE
jgi:hypothetical protein